MSKRFITLAAVWLFACTVSTTTARSLSAKTLYYISAGRIQSCTYWSLYLGNFDVMLDRKFPGEPEQPLKASVNLSITSNGYVEGSGYSSKGAVKCRAEFALCEGADTLPALLDSLDYVCNAGGALKLLNGKSGSAVVDVEGFAVLPRKMQLNVYTMQKVYGEEALKPSAELTISAFSFTKEGIARALEQMKSQ